MHTRDARRPRAGHYFNDGIKKRARETASAAVAAKERAEGAIDYIGERDF